MLKISPNNRIPAIVDSDCLICLGEKTGKFWPKGDLATRAPVLEWLMWQIGGFGPMPHQLSHFLVVENEAGRRYGIERYSKESLRLHGVLDKRLGVVECADGEMSIADFAILGWAWRHERHRIDLAHFPHVRRWYETPMARLGVRRGFGVALS